MWDEPAPRLDSGKAMSGLRTPLATDPRSYLMFSFSLSPPSCHWFVLSLPVVLSSLSSLLRKITSLWAQPPSWSSREPHRMFPPLWTDAPLQVWALLCPWQAQTPKGLSRLPAPHRATKNILGLKTPLRSHCLVIKDMLFFFLSFSEEPYRMNWVMGLPLRSPGKWSWPNVVAVWCSGNY